LPVGDVASLSFFGFVGRVLTGAFFVSAQALLLLALGKSLDEPESSVQNGEDEGDNCARIDLSE
jgi:hypothetical protein